MMIHLLLLLLDGDYRTILIVASKKQWPVFKMDVKSAFLNCDLKEEVYVEHPPGFEHPKSKGMVYMLKAALYGLKQAP